jgi:hypothetical protein
MPVATDQILMITAKMLNVNGVESDGSQNSFVFQFPPTSEGAVAAVKAFYNDNTHGVGKLISAGIRRDVGGLVIETYDITGKLDGAPHGSPISVDASTSLAFASAANGDLPEEVSMCCSYQADLSGTLTVGPTTTMPSTEEAIDQGAPATHSGRSRPQSSLRGRIYIGPLGIQSLAVTGKVDPVSALLVGNAAKQLRDTAIGWCVWSRRTASVHNVVRGWVDTDFTSHRSRVNKARTKLLWT